MRKLLRHANIGKILAIGILAALFLVFAGCAKEGQAGQGSGFTDFSHIEKEYLDTLKTLDFPEGTVLPTKLEGEEKDASYQIGYGETRASYLWENAWMKEWLNTYQTEPERAERALKELEKAFDMAYMGKDRCDDATRNYLRENIAKAKKGDPSGFEESIGVN